ncbi:MAG: hypothetical protein C4525_02575 [Desulfarculus sp.]|jgi:hypothetical protein|nr:MAG: hypothetical protein C4525_02575 [Desulfarculus sp.]
MKTRYRTTTAAAALILSALLLAAACQTPPKGATISREKAWTPAKLAVLPFEKVQTAPGGRAPAWSPLTRAAHIGGSIIPGAEQSMDNALASMLPRISNIPLVPAAQASLVFQRLSGRDLEDTLRDEIVATGRQLGADAVLVGFIYRFSQRVGGPYAATQPAAVSFDLSVVRTRDGAIIWRDTFEERQQSLSQNFLALEQYMRYGMRWYTAQEMGAIGLEQVLSRFPWRKTSNKKE